MSTTRETRKIAAGRPQRTVVAHPAARWQPPRAGRSRAPPSSRGTPYPQCRGRPGRSTIPDPARITGTTGHNRHGKGYSMDAAPRLGAGRPRRFLASPARTARRGSRPERGRAASATVVRRVHTHVPEPTCSSSTTTPVDGTAAEAAAAGATVVTLPFTLGVGGAMRTGYTYALRHGYDVVVQVDGDGQHDVRDLPDSSRHSSDADVVIGARFADGTPYEVGGARRFAMRILAAVHVPRRRHAAHRQHLRVPRARPAGHRACSPSTTPPSTSATRSRHWSSPAGAGWSSPRSRSG